jgi:hypothetical protein
MLDTQQKSASFLTGQLGQGADHLSSSSMQSAMPADALTAGPSIEAKSASKDGPPDGGGPRPTNLVFRYNEDMMRQFARGNPEAKAVLNRIQSFEDGSVKDGASLSDEEKFCMAVDSMGTGKDAEAILQAVFFGDIGGGIYDDHVASIRGGGGSVTVKFWHPGSEVLLQSQSFTGAVAFVGKDDNMREKRVQAAKNGYISKMGNKVAYGRDSFVAGHTTEIEDAFVDSPEGARFKAVPAAERHGTEGFKAAYQEYLYDKVLVDHAEKIAYRIADPKKGEGLMVGWMEENPCPVDGAEAWAKKLALKAMEYVIGYDNPELFADKHNSWRVEDEAAAQILVGMLVPGLTVNYDSDNFTVEVGKLPKSLSVRSADPEKATDDDETAVSAAPSAAVKPVPALPVVTKNMTRIKAHIISTGDGGPENVGRNGDLAATLDAEGKTLWGSLGIESNAKLSAASHQLKSPGELGPYKDFLQAWYDWEDAQANGGDAAATKTAFETALASFLAACNDGVNGAYRGTFY